MTGLKLIRTLELLDISSLGSPDGAQTGDLPLDPTGDFRHPAHDST